MNPVKERLLHAFGMVLILAGVVAQQAMPAAPAATTPHIVLDQFGYLPSATKIAVIADPQVGYNSSDPYAPGPSMQVRRWDDDTIVFEATPAIWKNGTVHNVSGDKCWWFDFSAVVEPGRYYIWDPANGKGTGAFQVAPDVYRAVAIQAMRVYFYQRCGQAKQPPYVPAQWQDDAAFLADNQDPKCRLVSAPNDPSTERDLRGGWFDAGDYTKYTTFARGTLQDLLLAYEDHPEAWGDDHGIPESGNGIPDILDEIKWELDWLLRMQQPDGSLLSKVSVTSFQAGSPPSTTTAPRYYGAASTSATMTGADIFAHAAIVFKTLGTPATDVYAATLATAATRAWDWTVANPSVLFDNTGFASADPEGERTSDAQTLSRLRAACKLYALTGDTKYRDFFDANYSRADLLGNAYYLSPYITDLHSALLYYLRIPGGTPAVKTAIANAFRNGVSHLGDYLPAATNATDPYMAYLAGTDYTWGSNSTKGKKGGMFLWMLQENLDPANATAYRDAAAGFLHYIHGTNPINLVFLSNMGAFGATNSVSSFYHSWFGSGIYSDLVTNPASPAPGYLTGGPDAGYAPDSSYAGPRLAPPLDQPPMKAYRDWNTAWPEDSWEVTEPAIYYQAAYVRLLAGFLGRNPSNPAANQALVRRLFLAVLGRDADSGALSAFAAALAGGRSPAALVGDLFGSAEYSARQIEPAIRLYYAALARPPDYTGLQNWSNALHAGTLTLTGAADLFAASQEFLLRYGTLDNTGYVQQLYRNVLGREADPAGLADWVGQLNGGASRGQILVGFSESNEFKGNLTNQVEILRLYLLLLQRMPTAAELQTWQGFLLGYGQTDALLAQGNPAGLADADFVQAVFRGFLRRDADAGTLSTFGSALTAGTVSHASLVGALLNSTEFNLYVAPVSRLYLAALRRVPDAPGLDNWVNYVRAGNSLQVMAGAFAASQEFANRYAVMTNSQYVAQLYRDVLGREPDPAGLASWTALLDSGGTTRGQILIGFSESQEAIHLFAPTLHTFLHYFTFLNAAPAQQDLNYWTNYLATLDDQMCESFLDGPNSGR